MQNGVSEIGSLAWIPEWETPHIDLSNLCTTDARVERARVRLELATGHHFAAYRTVAMERSNGLCQTYKAAAISSRDYPLIQQQEVECPGVIFVAYQRPLSRIRPVVRSSEPRPRSSSCAKVMMSWSSGKDSYAALRSLVNDDRYDVTSLFSVVNTREGQVPMHAVSITLLKLQINALGFQHNVVPLNIDDSTDYQILIDDAKRAGVRYFAFGDLFLEEIRQSRETNMTGSGISTLFPLWGKPTLSSIMELIHEGMRAVITSVDLKALPASFLGRELTAEVVTEITERGCDPSGENGEYHSFVFDGPLFNHPVDFRRGEVTIGAAFGHLQLNSAAERCLKPRSRDQFDRDGFAVLPCPDELLSELRNVSSKLIEMANSIYEDHGEKRALADISELRHDLGEGLPRKHSIAYALRDNILRSGHEIVPQSIFRLLETLSTELGIDVVLDKAICRFRIASPASAEYDHTWHQDSLDPPSNARSDRTSTMGFWVPLHDSCDNNGVIEFALGSHFRPILHTERDSFGRMCVDEDYVQAYEKVSVPVRFGEIAAFDSWAVHRTAPISPERTRLALLVWL